MKQIEMEATLGEGALAQSCYGDTYLADVQLVPEARMSDDPHALPTAPLRKVTLLYGLALQGSGSGDVESLFSYLLALSMEHSASAATRSND